MSYREEGDKIILTMSREDYTTLLMELGGAMFLHIKDGDSGADKALAWLNRLNEGNPHYTAYAVPGEMP